MPTLFVQLLLKFYGLLFLICSTTPTKAERAAYLWNPQNYPVSSCNSSTHPLVLTAKHWEIERVWISAETTYSHHGQMAFTQPDQLRRLLGLMQNHGIKTGLLAGESEWTLAEYAEPMFQLVWLVNRWNKNYPDTPWDEIHLDVEPHGRPGFVVQRTSDLQSWKQGLQLVAETGRFLQIPVSISIPTTAPLQITTRPLAIPWELAGQFKSVSVMAYRRSFDGSNGLISLMDPIFADAQHTESQARIQIAIELMTAAPGRIGLALVSDHPPFFPAQIPAWLERGVPVRLHQVGNYYLLGLEHSDSRSQNQKEWLPLLEKAGFRPITPTIESKIQITRELLDTGEFTRIRWSKSDLLQEAQFTTLSYMSRIPSSITLYGQSSEEVATHVERIEKRYRDYDQFFGVVFHDLCTLVPLTPSIP
jgi:hypothetical protein